MVGQFGDACLVFHMLYQPNMNLILYHGTESCRPIRKLTCQEEDVEEDTELSLLMPALSEVHNPFRDIAGKAMWS